MTEAKMTLVRGQGGVPEPLDEDLWVVERVARFLGMSIHWVYRAAERGEIPYLKIGSRLRFDPATVKAWARQREG
jgi:excisionase family DNA binding protein